MHNIVNLLTYQAEKPSAPTLYTNRALCCMKMGMWTQVVEDCQKAVQLQSSTIKAHFLMGKALVELQKYDDALASLHTGEVMLYDLHMKSVLNQCLSSLQCST